MMVFIELAGIAGALSVVVFVPFTLLMKRLLQHEAPARSRASEGDSVGAT
jgi:hypothetical protein